MTPPERPYIDRPVTDREAADAAARGAASRWCPGAEPTVLRYGMNALYGIDGAVLRVGHTTAPAAASHHLVETMAAHGVPTVTPIPGWALDRDGLAITGWQRLDACRTGRDADHGAWEQIGAAVATVHRTGRDELPDDYPVPSPRSFPWWDFDTMLAGTRRLLDDRAARGIISTIERGRWWVERIGQGAVVCHGDVHPGNVLLSGIRVLLIDWDLLCVANPAWDHAMLLTNAQRWGGEPWVYDAFAAGYGRSFADDELAVTLGGLRNVAATLMKVRAGETDPAAATEAERRLRYWRGDPDPPAWSAQ